MMFIILKSWKQFDCWEISICWIYYLPIRILISDQMLLKIISKDFPGGLVAKTPCFQWGGPGSISGQGTSSCMLQLRPSTAK